MVADALATGRPFVKFTGTTTDAVTINNRDVTLLADTGAKLTNDKAGIILKIDGTSNVKIFDLTIADGLGASGTGISMQAGNSATLELRRAKVINNGGAGISAADGTLVVTQSEIRDNDVGGISISGAQFDITNNVLSGNGGGSSILGGVRLDGITTAGTHVLDFNTITANLGPGTINTGITCGTVLVPLVFANNIVYANIVSGGGVQVGGSANCTTTYSDVGPDTVAGTGNINLDPMFVSPSQNDFHLLTGSPAKDAANPSSTTTIDIDGDARPQGVRRDMGADEFKQ